ncbi:HAD family hydrolase [Xanthobacter autotrophicus]|uniref:hypothetical protein n=1 Tax=Xanthobacter autotrophicus TaxID=280 RepID=UPI003727AE4A
MTLAPLKDIKVCVFDAYGTLFDFSSAARACADELGEKTAPLTALWRDKQVQYTWLLAAQGRHADFHQVTGNALDSTGADAWRAIWSARWIGHLPPAHLY